MLPLQWLKERGIVERLVDFIGPRADPEVSHVSQVTCCSIHVLACNSAHSPCLDLDVYMCRMFTVPLSFPCPLLFHFLPILSSPCSPPLSLFQQCGNASQALCDMIRLSREAAQMASPTPLLSTLERWVWMGWINGYMGVCI